MIAIIKNLSTQITKRKGHFSQKKEFFNQLVQLKKDDPESPFIATVTDTVEERASSVISGKHLEGYCRKAIAHYKRKYGINIKFISSETLEDSEQCEKSKKMIEDALLSDKPTAFVVNDYGHCSTFIASQGKLYAMFPYHKKNLPSYYTTLKLDKKKSSFYLSAEAFHINQQDMRAPQADQVSCALFATKYAKELLKDNEKLFKLSYTDTETKTDTEAQTQTEVKNFYPHPLVFKYAQSDKFLERYVADYKEAHQRIKGTDLSDDDKNIKMLNDYREKYTKYRMAYFGIKNYQGMQNILPSRLRLAYIKFKNNLNGKMR